MPPNPSFVRPTVVLAILVGMSASAPPAGAAAIGESPVVTGLAFPAAFTFAPDGRIFYGERWTGEIHVFDSTTSSDTLFFTVPDLATGSGEQGVLGVAVHPNYPSTPNVYVYAIRNVAGSPRAQILRLRDSGGTGTAMKVIFDVPGADHHNGGRLLFGPYKKLYLVIGDQDVPANAQDLSNDAGKILRMTPSGGVPLGNPFPGSYVFAYGIRNSFGFAFDPATGRLWATDNGPECNDELNRIRRGMNHGWGPSFTCSTPPTPPLNTNQDGPSPVLPKRWYGTPIAPTGLAFCSGCGLGSASEETLFFGDYNTGAIRRVVLNSTRYGVSSQAVVFTHSTAVLSVEAAPDGTIYFSDPTGIYELVMA